MVRCADLMKSRLGTPSVAVTVTWWTEISEFMRLAQAVLDDENVKELVIETSPVRLALGTPGTINPCWVISTSGMSASAENEQAPASAASAGMMGRIRSVMVAVSPDVDDEPQFD